jgi:hypothetical protein
MMAYFEINNLGQGGGVPAIEIQSFTFLRSRLCCFCSFSFQAFILLVGVGVD